MGLVPVILSKLIQTNNRLIQLMQKNMSPAYDPNTDSNEAISEKIDNLGPTICGEAKNALNTEIPELGLNWDSVWYILKVKLLPLLPLSGTISTLTTTNIKQQVSSSIKTDGVSGSSAGTVGKVLSDLSPRLPASGTLATTDDIPIPSRGQFKRLYNSTSSSVYTTVLDYTGSGKIFSISLSNYSGGCTPFIRITIDNLVFWDYPPYPSSVCSYIIYPRIPVNNSDDRWWLKFLNVTDGDKLDSIGYPLLNWEFKNSLKIEIKQSNIQVLYAEY